MRLIIETGTDPYFNLAIEEYALTRIAEDASILWRSTDSAVVGVNQNTAEEINAGYAEANGIDVVRRLSGGGAVYHDLGNINYTLITNSDDRSDFTSPIIDFFRTFGVEAEPRGRNDLVINGRKFCGSAQAVKNGRVMRHCCIMYSVNTAKLCEVLRPRAAKIESHGIKSVRSRVTNLADHMPYEMPVETFFAKMSDYLEDLSPRAHRQPLNDSEAEEVKLLAERKYRAWEWNFGASPEYNYENSARYAFGCVGVRMFVKSGVIDDIHVHGDFFGSYDISELEARLRGARHDRESIAQALKYFDLSACINGMTMNDWLRLVT